ncbi:hypothetical protein FJT64_017751 [Amphibalanus amphitrite]|uniref:Uncharacterized protein n=1 Tax=Amphibalanus amphitrite TaxID=1232801 RepID=A0A6A4XAM4_AMPAM|nr:hypothetical protein FJT64_017751 [Amphibalanus amphitrite]
MQKWLFLFHVSLGVAEEFFPDKTSVITNEHLAFYQRKDFYLITVPCAVAALFLICCVLCCTLYAREGVCHLFDFPEELRRHASGEHFLTVDEFLELERRHRLGLPVESLLELEKKRRSEAGAGIPKLEGDQPVGEEGWPQPEGDADTWAQPQEPPTSDAVYMSGQSDARMVAGKQQPSSRSRSEEPRDLAGDSPRGSAAWLLHRIRSLRGVSEQPTVSSRSSQRRRQERRTDRLNRSHGPQDSLTGSEGAVSGAADWPSSVEDLEEVIKAILTIPTTT